MFAAVVQGSQVQKEKLQQQLEQMERELSQKLSELVTANDRVAEQDQELESERVASQRKDERLGNVQRELDQLRADARAKSVRRVCFYIMRRDACSMFGARCARLCFSCVW